MRELADERIQRHAVLQGHAGECADAVHQAADGGTFLRHGDEELARLAVFEQADREVAFVARDVELVRERRPRIRQPTTERQARLLAQLDDFVLEFQDAHIQSRSVSARRNYGCGFVAAVIGLLRVERLAPLGAVAVNGDAFEAHLPSLHIGVTNVLHGRLVRQIDGLGDRAADERLRRPHHFQVRHVVNAALALECFERAIEHGQMLGLEAAAEDRAVFAGDVLDGVVLLNVRDDGGDLAVTVAEAIECFGHSAIYELQHAATGEQFVLHQGDVGFHASSVAVHEEGDRSSRREHGDLRVAIAMLPAFGESAVPGAEGFLLEIVELAAGLNGFHGVAVLLHHAERGFDVVLRDRLAHAGATRVLVTLKGTHVRRDVGALLIGFTRHDGRDGAGERTAFVAVVSQAVAHDERAEVREAETERAVDVRVLGDDLRGIARVIDDDFLRGDVDAHGGLEALDIERGVIALELHEVQRREIAGSVVEEDVFAARVGRVNRLRAFAGMPFLDRAVVLQAGVAANPGALRDFVEQRRGVLLLERLAVDGLRPPFLAVHRSLHELIAHAHGQVFILIHDAAVGIAIIGTVVALLDERPSLLLFPLLGIDEFLDVTMPVAQRVHLGRATGLAAALHDVRDLVIDLEEAHRAARTTTAAQLLATGTDGRQVGAGAGTILEEHRLGVSEVHDAFHVVIHGLDETRTALRIFVLRRGAFADVLGPVVEPVALRRFLADTVLVIQTDVEPHGRVEGAVLVYTQPSELVVERFTVRLAEVTILHAPVGNRTRDTMDELAHGRFALGGVLFAVKVFGDDDLGRQHGP